MPYTPLRADSPLPEHVQLIVRKGFDQYLREIHWLLCTEPPAESNTHFHQSMFGNLCSVLSSISATLYAKPGTNKALFVGLIVDWFPWDKCSPPDEYGRQGFANVLYDVLRNPLIHTAGLREKGTRRLDLEVVVKSESGVTNLEKLEAPLRPCMLLDNARILIYADTLYWATRKIIETILANAEQVTKAEQWIAAGSFQNPEGKK